MTSFAIPRNIASLTIVIIANVFLFALTEVRDNSSFLMSIIIVSCLGFLASWVFIFNGIRFPDEKYFKYSFGILSGIVLVNGIFTWSQGNLNLAAMLMTASQSVLPLVIVFMGNQTRDNLLFDLVGMSLLFAIPVFFDASQSWVINNSRPTEAIPLLISAISAVVIFKPRLGNAFHLPFDIDREKLLTALFVIVATVSCLVFFKAFAGSKTVVGDLNWSSVLPFGWVTYIIPAVFAEVIFRGVLMNWAEKVTGSLSLAIAVSAIAYGLLETGYLVNESKLALVAGICLGVFNGLAYHKSRSLTAPILGNVGFVTILAILGL